MSEYSSRDAVIGERAPEAGFCGRDLGAHGIVDCLAGGTNVAVPGGGWRAVELFQVGDKVLALNAAEEWEERVVQFSNGTGSGSVIPMAIYILFEDQRELIVTPDHVLMLQTRVLKQAQALSPGEYLLGADLKPVRIVKVERGEWQGRIHNIATSGGPQDGPAGHLLNTAGVISGDFMVQIQQQQQDEGE